MSRPGLVAFAISVLTCASIVPRAAAQEARRETVDGEPVAHDVAAREGDESDPVERTNDAPPQDDLDLEMAGWPLLVVSAVMWVQYVFARTQIDAFNNDPRVDAYRVVIGDTDPESTDICANAEASVGNTEAAYVRGACRRGADAEARGWAFLTLGLLTAATGIVFIAVDLAIEPAAPMTLSVGPGRIDLSGTF